MIATLAWKEFRSLFASPLAWVILAVIQLVMALVFFWYLSQYFEIMPRIQQLANPPGVTEIVVGGSFYFAAILLQVAVALLSMRLLSDEYRNRTISLLLSAPISSAEIALGKFCGLMLFLLIPVGLLTLMSASLALGGVVDWGLIGANLLALVLLLAVYSALGLLISSLTAHPLLAGFGTFMALVLLMLLNILATDPNATSNYLSPLSHFEILAKGLIDTSNLSFLVILTVTLLVLASKILDRRRMQG